ncbi:hypothetical protein PFISCL1PPCAC_24897, partial [Pristionchus fissidentatus]
LSRLLDKYVDPRFDVTLFDRFFNWEVAALSFLVRNTEVGRRFVRNFASWEFKLPNVTAHGTDNGALHPYLMEMLAPGPSRIKEVCYEIWNRSSSSRDLFKMEACTRTVIGDRVEFPEHSLRILPKGKAWVRDIFLLSSAWADDDFMVSKLNFHATKEDNFRSFFADSDDPARKTDEQLITWLPQDRAKAYIFPLLNKFDLDQCMAGNATWSMDGRLRISTERKRRVLDKFDFGVLKMRFGFAAMLSTAFEKK